jgi:hypothetical protein
LASKELRGSISRRGTQSKLRFPSKASVNPLDDEVLLLEKVPSVGRIIVQDDLEYDSPASASAFSPADQIFAAAKFQQLPEIINEKQEIHLLIFLHLLLKKHTSDCIKL